MADQRQINSTYNYMDRLFRLSMGENADITAAMFNGDFSKSLEQAQRDKHAYILQQIRFTAGKRVLDIGCGWGGLLRAVREAGGYGVGLTLSTTQAEACIRKAFEVYLLDWRDMSLDTFGYFDCIACVGAFEHFCSEEEYRSGVQEETYRRFFRLCHSLLHNKGRMYLQTMLMGERMPPFDTISLKAQKGSDEYITAVLKKFYPGSWLPLGVEQIRQTAAPYFSVVSLKNGREDYIETMSQWGRCMRRFSLAKFLAALLTSRYLVIDPDFRYKLELLRGSYNLECFRRRLLDHQRIVLEKL
jgi:cyclopropane-fatty-acyl-phospholipid synthase